VQTETEETREEPAATHTQPQLQPQPCGDRNAPLRAYLAHRQELLQTLRRAKEDRRQDTGEVDHGCER